MAKCSLCEKRQAKSYGLPVCRRCFRNLMGLDSDLKEMEASDPVLKELGQRVEDSARKYLDGR